MNSASQVALPPIFTAAGELVGVILKLTVLAFTVRDYS